MHGIHGWYVNVQLGRGGDAAAAGRGGTQAHRKKAFVCVTVKTGVLARERDRRTRHGRKKCYGAI